MKRGRCVVSGVRRSFSTAHGEAALRGTLRIPDAACRVFPSEPFRPGDRVAMMAS